MTFDEVLEEYPDYLETLESEDLDAEWNSCAESGWSLAQQKILREMIDEELHARAMRGDLWPHDEDDDF